MTAPWDAVRNVLLVRLDNAGDVVLLSPAVAAIRAALPHARVTLLASTGGAPAATLIEGIDAVLTHEAIWQQLRPGRVGPADEQRLIETLRAGRFDAAFIFTSFSQTAFAAAYACFLAGIPIRAGHAALFGGQLLTHEVPAPSARLHQAERALHLVRGVGFDALDARLRLGVPAEAHAEARALLAEHGVTAPYVVVAPGASAPARRYPAAAFAEVVRGLREALGAPVLVVGSAREAELVAQVAAGEPGAVALAGRTSLPGVAALVAGARAVVANNSLTMHLADSLGVPVVATYSGTDPAERWAPRVVPSRLLTRETDCAPCFHIDCPRALECLDIPPAEVVAAVAELTRAGREDMRRVVA
ncbi:MAG: glycosyltransferase family 9 protein [Dehalococcoidia bacterium]